MALSDDYNAAFELCVEMKIKEQDEWITPIVHYLKEGWLPEDKMEPRKIQIRAAHFIIIDDVLYR